MPPFFAFLAVAFPAFCLETVGLPFLDFGLPILINSFIAILHKPSTLAERTTPNMAPQRQRIRTIKKSLDDMSMDELQKMSDDLTDLIQVLITRQVVIEDVIMERLEEMFVK